MIHEHKMTRTGILWACHCKIEVWLTSLLGRDQGKGVLNRKGIRQEVACSNSNNSNHSKNSPQENKQVLLGRKVDKEALHPRRDNHCPSNKLQSSPKQVLSSRLHNLNNKALLHLTNNRLQEQEMSLWVLLAAIRNPLPQTTIKGKQLPAISQNR